MQRDISLQNLKQARHQLQLKQAWAGLVMSLAGQKGSSDQVKDHHILTSRFTAQNFL